eukprot:4421951-Amphidinium_carterae.1
MSEEVNRVPLDKSTITFFKASNILEKRIQQYQVARKHKARIEPQKMVVIVTKIAEAVRLPNCGDSKELRTRTRSPSTCKENRQVTFERMSLKPIWVKLPTDPCPTYANPVDKDKKDKKPPLVPQPKVRQRRIRRKMTRRRKARTKMERTSLHNDLRLVRLLFQIFLKKKRALILKIKKK